jgi:hypothetical protein
VSGLPNGHLCTTHTAKRFSPMIIIGCDYHPGFQQIACLQQADSTHAYWRAAKILSVGGGSILTTTLSFVPIPVDRGFNEGICQ